MLLVMAKTASTMLPLGTPAPDFSLVDVATRRSVQLADFAPKRALGVIFFCNHCPFVKHIQAGLVALGKDYEGKDVALVAISSNDAEKHPDDAPAKLAAEAARVGYRFPVLFDESQKAAQAYQAACTPDFYLFDASRTLVYRGQFDDARPGSDIPVTGRDYRAAIDAVLAGRPVPAAQKASVGCNIKWRPGNEPPYYGSTAV
jgi:peroxiredoxin